MNWCKNKELTDTRYLLEEPEKRFPKYIHKYKNIYISSSKYANYTNNPVLYDREWFLKNIIPQFKDSIGRNNEEIPIRIFSRAVQRDCSSQNFLESCLDLVDARHLNKII